MNEFDKWNKLKKKLNEKRRIRTFDERDIFYVNMGKNIGFEQNGKGHHYTRPVLILKKFNNHLFWGIPLTSSTKNEFLNFEFSFIDNKRSFALIHQLKLFDAKRLAYKIGVVNKSNFFMLKTKIGKILCLTDFM